MGDVVAFTTSDVQRPNGQSREQQHFHSWERLWEVFRGKHEVNHQSEATPH